jgi:hypothetical protein
MFFIKEYAVLWLLIMAISRIAFKKTTEISSLSPLHFLGAWAFQAGSTSRPWFAALKRTSQGATINGQ